MEYQRKAAHFYWTQEEVHLLRPGLESAVQLAPIEVKRHFLDSKLPPTSTHPLLQKGPPQQFLAPLLPAPQCQEPILETQDRRAR